MEVDRSFLKKIGQCNRKIGFGLESWRSSKSGMPKRVMEEICKQGDGEYWRNMEWDKSHGNQSCQMESSHWCPMFSQGVKEPSTNKVLQPYLTLTVNKVQYIHPPLFVYDWYILITLTFPLQNPAHPIWLDLYIFHQNKNALVLGNH